MHQKYTEFGKRRVNLDERFRCPTCRTRDEDTVPVTSVEQCKAAAFSRNGELTAIRKQVDLDSQM